MLVAFSISLTSLTSACLKAGSRLENGSSNKISFGEGANAALTQHVVSVRQINFGYYFLQCVIPVSDSISSTRLTFSSVTERNLPFVKANIMFSLHLDAGKEQNLEIPFPTFRCSEGT